MQKQNHLGLEKDLLIEHKMMWTYIAENPYVVGIYKSLYDAKANYISKFTDYEPTDIQDCCFLCQYAANIAKTKCTNNRCIYCIGANNEAGCLSGLYSDATRYFDNDLGSLPSVALKIANCADELIATL